MKQLKEVERKEAVHELQKEGRKIAEQLTMVVSTYDENIETLREEMGSLKLELDSVEGERNSQVETVENQLKQIGKRIQELEMDHEKNGHH
jgi:prefoldin subunit 5